MSRGLALLLVVLAFGCDDTTVRANIIDNFVCTYMPWWMGDCQGTETVAAVMGVLDHGIVSADATCECDMRNDADTHTSHFGPYRVQKLFDGSCFIRSDGSITQFRARYEECVVATAAPYSLADGEFRYLNDANPANRYRAPVSTCCTGFNLAAFGVEE